MFVNLEKYKFSSRRIARGIWGHAPQENLEFGALYGGI
jgi:hypothetical protein